MNKHKLYVSIKGKVRKIISNVMFWSGVALDSAVVIYLFLGIREEEYFSTLFGGFFVLFLPGAALIHFGNRRKKEEKLIDKYLKYINARRNINMDILCQKIGVTKEKAIQDITELINENIINGYIDENNTLILSKYEEFEKAKEKEESENIIVVKCPECGAKNTISIGVAKECMYCGTVLHDTTKV